MLTNTTREFKSELEASSVVSSAKRDENSLEDSGKSFMYIRNSIGPRIEPCGTPQSIKRGSEEMPLISTYCDLSVK